MGKKYDVDMRTQGTIKERKSNLGCIVLILLALLLCGLMGKKEGSSSTTHKTSSIIPEKSQAAVPTRARVIVQGANLWLKPSSNITIENKLLMELEAEERLELLSASYVGKGWYHVRHSGTKQEGWIHGNNIELEE